MMKKEIYSMCVLYRDDGTRFKKFFDSKNSALDWFGRFQNDNKRSVTVIFYCGVTPYWIFRRD